MRAEIITWNPINVRTSVLHTSISIKPTLEILEFFNRSVSAVVKITGTGSCYDNHNMFATIDKSSDVTNKRDNFFNSTGLYVITLDILWYGFPLKNGVVEFQEGIVNDIIDYVSKCDNPSDKLNTLNVSKEGFTTEIDKGEKDEGNCNGNGNSNGNGIDEYIREYKDEKPCREDPKGFDKTILLICGMSVALIMILSINN